MVDYIYRGFAGQDPSLLERDVRGIIIGLANGIVCLDTDNPDIKGSGYYVPLLTDAYMQAHADYTNVSGETPNDIYALQNELSDCFDGVQEILRRSGVSDKEKAKEIVRSEYKITRLLCKIYSLTQSTPNPEPKKEESITEELEEITQKMADLGVSREELDEYIPLLIDAHLQADANYVNIPEIDGVSMQGRQIEINKYITKLKALLNSDESDQAQDADARVNTSNLGINKVELAHQYVNEIIRKLYEIYIHKHKQSIPQADTVTHTSPTRRKPRPQPDTTGRGDITPGLDDIKQRMERLDGLSNQGLVDLLGEIAVILDTVNRMRDTIQEEVLGRFTEDEGESQ
jgi:hypothetical protein